MGPTEHFLELAKMHKTLRVLMPVADGKGKIARGK
jgi:hypothetical protein